MIASGALHKAVILARGLGTRMRRDDAAAALNQQQSEAADSGVKAMIPVGRPFLDYVLSGLVDAGFRQACLVIGPEHQLIRDYYNRLKATVLEIRFAEQSEALGTANALLAAEAFADGGEFLTINADNYYPADALLAIQQMGQAGAVLFPANTLIGNGNISPDRIKEFACAAVDEKGFLFRIMEKPRENPPSECLVSMNCWRLGSAIFSFCREVPLSPRGEFELPLAVNLGIERGLRMKVAISQGGVLDLSRRSDIGAVTSRLKDVRVNL